LSSNLSKLFTALS